MNSNDADLMLLAMLDELPGDAARRHAERMAGDDAYRAAFAGMLELRRALLALEAPAGKPGLDARVAAALQARDREDERVRLMARQFWRVAGPALAAATILITLAMRGQTATVNTDQVSLTAWYQLSDDPTVTLSTEMPR